MLTFALLLSVLDTLVPVDAPPSATNQLAPLVQYISPKWFALPFKNVFPFTLRTNPHAYTNLATLTRKHTLGEIPPLFFPPGR